MARRKTTRLAYGLASCCKGQTSLPLYAGPAKVVGGECRRILPDVAAGTTGQRAIVNTVAAQD